MNSKWNLGGLLLVLFLAVSSAGAVPSAERKEPNHKKDELLVRLRPGAVRENLGPDVVAARAFRTPASAKGLAVERWRVVTLRNNADMAKVRGRLLRNPNVELVEYNYEVTANLFTNDPSFSQLWGLHNTGQTGGAADADIDAPEAWDVAQGELAPAVVGVIDTGVDYNHPDLAQNIWTNPNEIPGNGIDDDANGYVDDVHGYDFVNHDGDPMDDHGHGTHVSGTIAAVADNGIGVVGVSRNARIMGVKFLSASGSGYTADAVSAVLYATSMGAHMTNNSWGGGGFSQALYDAIAAANTAGSLFVAAAGNNYGSDNDVYPHYPSNYEVDNVISVAATNSTDTLAYFSNLGATTVDLAAPGEGILSTTPGNTYATYSGTSMATPHVTGALAVLKGLYPASGHLALKSRLLGAVDELASLSGKVLTGGRLNLNNALETDTVPPAAITDLTVLEMKPFEARIGWTAVGDDGMTGLATEYVIYYSTGVIDDTTLPVTPFVIVNASGTTNEQHVVKNLAPGTVYHFRVVAVDNVGNRSGLSNDAEGQTTIVVTVLRDDFENGLVNWTIQGTDGVGGPALWHESSFRYVSPTKAAYYGIEGTYTFNTGATNRGSLTSKALDLRYTESPWLSFTYSLRTEGSTYYDAARVMISTNGTTWTQLAFLPNTYDGMETVNIDLTPYERSVVYIRFDFDTIDSLYNDYEGWIIDDVSVIGGSREAPTASLVGPGEVSLNVPVTYDAGASFDPQGDPLTFDWFVDGVSRGTATAITESFTSYGIHTVSVTVSDGMHTDTLTKSVNVRNLSPIVSLVGPTLVDRYVEVTYDAGGTTDPEGDPLTFTWYRDGSLAGTGPQLTTYFGGGTHWVGVEVNDGYNTVYRELVVEGVNHAPVLSLSGPTVANRIDPVTYTATATDADGDFINYVWYVDGSYVDAYTSMSHVFTTPGLHTVEVFASDYYGGEAYASQPVEVTNSVPVVSLTGPSLVNGSNSVTFDAGGSTDADGDPLTFAWTLDGAPVGAGPTLTTSFTQAGLHTVEVTVTDGYDSASAVQNVEVINAAPVVTLTGPATAARNAPVAFDASTSTDPDGDTLTFAWAVDGVSVAGTASALTKAFTTPGAHTVTVAVSDAFESVSQSVTIDVQNSAPTVSLTGPTTANRIEAATFAATAADPDGDTLTYTWLVDGVQAGNGPTLSHLFSTIGQHVVEVTVSDGYAGASASQSVEVINIAPIAALSGPTTADRVNVASFSASGSTDPDGDTLTYTWTYDGQAGGPASGNPSFPFLFTELGTHTIEVVVSDGMASVSKTMTVEVINLAPTANAGAPQTVVQKMMVTVNGSGSDPDGTALTYLWTQIAGPTATLLNANTATVSFEAPALRGVTSAQVTLQLTVTDADGASHSAQNTITVLKN